MKTLIISDIHLTPLFNQNKFDYLKKLFNRFDRIIVNGDLYDGYLFSFDQFAQSKWKPLLEILRSKKTMYFYGNHDKGTWIKGKAEKYVDYTDKVHKVKYGKYLLWMEHGDLINRSIAEKIPWAANRITAWIVHFIRIWGVIIFGDSFYKKLNPYHILVHKDLKSWAKQNLKDGQILICGHSHTACLDLENHYANSGFVGQGWASYLVLEDNEIKLVEERY
jgi:UDP-2,3-diacylglucosamine pyrophosphatase LpxH